MIEAIGLSKSFKGNSVLKNIDLKLAGGLIHGIIGRSGAGKSTFLRCINGLESYEDGRMLVDGVHIKDLKGNDLLAFRKGIGMIFQHFSLLSRMNVYDNIVLPMQTWGYSQKVIDERVKTLLELVGIPEKTDVFPSQLSGGQKQRVAIARALALEPKILLCDEATSALDPKTAESIIHLLSGINKEMGITIIMVSHQISVLRRICHEIVMLEGGAVAAQGETGAVFSARPKALQNIIGDEDFILPDDGVAINMILKKEQCDIPFITRMVRDLNIDFSIVKGETDHYRDLISSNIVINVGTNDIEAVETYLQEKGAMFRRLEKQKSEQ